MWCEVISSLPAVLICFSCWFPAHPSLEKAAHKPQGSLGCTETVWGLWVWDGEEGGTSSARADAERALLGVKTPQNP